MEVHRKISGSFKPFLINTTMNVCKGMEGTGLSFFGAFAIKWVRENSKTNMIHGCPFYVRI